MKTALLFPGQGAQTVGMGAEIAENFPKAAEIFKKAEDIVGFNLSQVCFKGPAEKLNTTTISQPAIFVTSAAILEVLRNSRPDSVFTDADVTAGLSLGEYTALYAAGVLSFTDALVLVQKRGRAMQAAAEATEGAMVSIIGLDEENVNRLCREAGEGELLAAVNFNCPGQIVISGTKDACERAGALAEKYGAIKAVRLQVAGAFHTEMMVPATNMLRGALANSDIHKPGRTAIIANIDAEYYTSAEGVAQGLIKQLTCPILWQKCMERLLADGTEVFYEIGPGKVLTGLMKRISRKAKVTNISTLQAVKQIIDTEVQANLPRSAETLREGE
jgi:[acyl-carrier-protein] S-malonyltransferase